MTEATSKEVWAGADSVDNTANVSAARSRKCLPMPFIEPGQILQRRLRMQMMDQMVTDVVRRQQHPAEESKMMVTRGSHGSLQAAVAIRLLHVFI